MIRLLCAVVAVLSSITPARADLFAPGTTVRVSSAADGTEPNGWSSAPVLSQDGRVAAFVSEASNLVPADTNGAADVFVRDLVTGAVTRTLDPAGNEFPHRSYTELSLSRDGRYVAFSVMGVGTFLYDRVADATTHVSKNENGDVQPTASPTVSSDGSRVMSHEYGQGWLWMRERGYARRLRDASGEVITGDGFTLSPDGRYASFTRWVPDPVFAIVYFLDLQTGDTEMVSDGATFSFLGTPSDGGRFVLYHWFPPASVLMAHLVRVDRHTGERAILPNAVEAMSAAAFSGDGRTIAFPSLGPIAVNPLTPFPGAYVWEPDAGTVTLASKSAEGAPSTSFSFGASVSHDGRYVGFAVPEPMAAGDANGVDDAYARDRHAPCTVACVLPG